MVKNKNFKMAKRLLLVLGITLLATTSAYAGYTLGSFNGKLTSLDNIKTIKTNISDLTTHLSYTADKLEGEKKAHSSEISDLNGEIDKANKYADSVSSAVANADETADTAASAISKAESANSYDPSTVGSSAK